MRQLAALCAVADHRSVARAAASLSWSQPTAAHHLRGLERELGAAVVSPGPGGTNLTAVGRQLLPHARSIIDRSERARQEVRAYVADRKKRVVLGIFPTAALLLLPSLLVRAEQQQLQLSVHEAEVDVLRQELSELRVDAAIVYTTASDGSRLPQECERQVIFAEPLRLIVPPQHRLAGTNGCSLADFADDDWILSAQADEPIELLLREIAAQFGFTPRAHARSDDYLLVAAYVSAGLGVALVPASVAAQTTSAVSAVGLDELRLHRSVELITQKSTDRDIVDFLRSTAQAAVPGSR
jgi:DNA-binding transcriptional LysR family regulator